VEGTAAAQGTHEQHKQYALLWWQNGGGSAGLVIVNRDIMYTAHRRGSRDVGEKKTATDLSLVGKNNLLKYFGRKRC